MTNHIERLQALEASAEKAKAENSRLDTLIEQATEQLKELLAEAKEEHGITSISELKNKIAEVEAEIEKKLLEAEKSLEGTEVLDQ